MDGARDPAGNKPKICIMCDKVRPPAGCIVHQDCDLYCVCEDMSRLSEVRVCVETEEFIYWEMDDRQTDLSDVVEE